MWTIDTDITRAETPPGSAYSDAVAHAHFVREVMPTTWQPVPGAHLPEISGGQRPTRVAGVPLVLTREGDTTRALSNVCTHRGAILVDSPCVGRSIRCPYHGRTFRLDGRFRRMPHFEGAKDFPRPQDSLAAVPLEHLGPLTFASIRPAASFAELTAPARRLWPWAEASFTRDPDGDVTWTCSASWAQYVENYLEGLHIPFVHPGLHAALEPGAYETTQHPGCVVQLGEARADELAFSLPASHPHDGRRIAAIYLWFFPTTMVNLYPWGISLNQVVPTGPTSCSIRYETWVCAPELRGRGAGAGLDKVEEEDQAVIDRVARGIGSPLYTRGRYSPSHEQGVHHFHRMWSASLAKPEDWPMGLGRAD